MKIKQYFFERFSEYNDSDDRYRLGNRILYNMVNQYPGNKDYNQIVAKMWIIGRTYAAAVERRPNKEETPGEFYYDYVAPTIANGRLDRMIKRIKSKKYSEINKKSIRDVLLIHKYLVDQIKGITEKEKRSLASKYLHFHLPKLVFIYDSRVAGSIGKFVGKCPSNLILDEYDEVYAKFVFKAYEIYKAIKEIKFKSRHGDTLPRVVDNFLLRESDSDSAEED